MYSVVKMYGDCEPWWFLDGWEEDIVSCKQFERYEEALRHYQQEWVYLSEEYPQRKSKVGMMTAFWEPEDQYWCEECDEHLQNFHSIMLLESKEVLPKGLQKSASEKRIRSCQIKS
ncbi:hypothetical protein J2T50_001575 [Streptococcus gallinaceus]|uniref:DUF1033 family protein n=1 Tax=Streptococcus gallinaceus TaxID=165758 RepID=UPI0020A06E9A|nr:DUF1033 family protein [Streptococcus gallinaceus]MCP1639865.1 hypothetical protein [Streptococcus gallinaceus]MCP1770763.1 hypothetical protein [Streptococcus gallinaceus]